MVRFNRKALKEIGKFNMENPQHRGMIGGVIRRIMREPFDTFNSKRDKLQIQNFTGESNFVEYDKKVFQIFEEKPIIDPGIELIFHVEDLQGDSGYDVEGTTTSITMKKIKPGGKIDYGKSTEDRRRVYTHMWGGGEEIDGRLITHKKIGKVEDKVRRVRDEGIATRNRAAYSLIEACPASIDVSWQDPTPSALPSTNERYLMSRDANTINQCIVNLIRKNEDKGYFSQPNGLVFPILYNIELGSRVTQALKYTHDNKQGGAQVVSWRTIPIPVLGLSSNTVFYVVLPQRNLTGGFNFWERPFVVWNMDNFTLKIGNWMDFAYDIGDIEQIARGNLGSG